MSVILRWGRGRGEMRAIFVLCLLAVDVVFHDGVRVFFSVMLLCEHFVFGPKMVYSFSFLIQMYCHLCLEGCDVL